MEVNSEVLVVLTIDSPTSIYQITIAGNVQIFVNSFFNATSMLLSPRHHHHIITTSSSPHHHIITTSSSSLLFSSPSLIVSFSALFGEAPSIVNITNTEFTIINVVGSNSIVGTNGMLFYYFRKVTNILSSNSHSKFCIYWKRHSTRRRPWRMCLSWCSFCL